MKRLPRGRAGDIRRGRAACAWQMKPTSNGFAYFIMIRLMTTISWIGSPRRRVTRVPERLWPAKARLSTCNLLDRRGRNRPRVVLMQRIQRTIVLGILRIENCQCPVVEDQPS